MRWKLYSSLERCCIDLSQFVGSGYIVLWYRAIGGKIGADVCLFPQVGALRGVRAQVTSPHLPHCCCASPFPTRSPSSVSPLALSPHRAQT